MRLAEPRITPLEDKELDDDARAQLAAMRDSTGDVANIFRTLARHPKLLKRWLVFGNHILAKSTLDAREREIAILRVGYRCRAIYEWTQHVRIGKATGLSDDEIEWIGEGPDAAGWSDFDAALLRATDELHDDAMISDASWAALTERYSTEQVLDFIFTVGQYHTVSMALNSLGVQNEHGDTPFPERGVS
jgi:4-carboxymuconolactone decarboxylase